MLVLWHEKLGVDFLLQVRQAYLFVHIAHRLHWVCDSVEPKFSNTLVTLIAFVFTACISVF
jgi:hypothetical protein